MNLFVFIVQPSCRKKKEWRTNKRRPPTTQTPQPPTSTHPPISPKGCIGRLCFPGKGKWFIFPIMKVTAAPGVWLLFTFRPPQKTFKFKYFRLCPDLLFQKARILPANSVSCPNCEPLLFVLTCQLRWLKFRHSWGPTQKNRRIVKPKNENENINEKGKVWMQISWLLKVATKNEYLMRQRAAGSISKLIWMALNDLKSEYIPN